MSEGSFFDYVTRLNNGEKHNREGWARELSVTTRTITNFNSKLEKEYGVIIDKKKGFHGYYFINKEKSIDYGKFVNYFQNLNSISNITQSFIDINGIGKHLLFHQNWNRVGWMKHFVKLLDAINNQQYISIKYYSFRTEEQKQLVDFMPYWMKQNAYFRWYVIGFEREDSTFPTVLGIDKIVSISIDENIFTRDSSKEDFKEEYENQFGVYIYQDRQPELVRIECQRFQAHYLKSLPLHVSQEVEYENDQVTVFRYKLIVNHEFAYELLRQNAWNFNENMLAHAHPKKTAIKVLEPEWLVDYFHQTYKRSYLTYSRDLVIIGKLKREIDQTEYPYPLPIF